MDLYQEYDIIFEKKVYNNFINHKVCEDIKMNDIINNNYDKNFNTNNKDTDVNFSKVNSTNWIKTIHLDNTVYWYCRQ